MSTAPRARCVRRRARDVVVRLSKSMRETHAAHSTRDSIIDEGINVDLTQGNLPTPPSPRGCLALHRPRCTDEFTEGNDCTGVPATQAPPTRRAGQTNVLRVPATNAIDVHRAAHGVSGMSHACRNRRGKVSDAKAFESLRATCATQTRARTCPACHFPISYHPRWTKPMMLAFRSFFASACQSPSCTFLP